MLACYLPCSSCMIVFRLYTQHIHYFMYLLLFIHIYIYIYTVRSLRYLPKWPHVPVHFGTGTCGPVFPWIPAQNPHKNNLKIGKVYFWQKYAYAPIGHFPCVSSLLQRFWALRFFFLGSWIWVERIFVSQDLGISPRARYEESGPPLWGCRRCCRDTTMSWSHTTGVPAPQQCLGVTQQCLGPTQQCLGATQQCLGATQQVRGSPKGGKNGLDGFEDWDYGPILSEVKATGFINLSRPLRTPKTVLKIKNIDKIG